MFGTTDDVTRSPQFEGYYQRGLGRHLALENSFAVWRIKTSPTPPAPESPRIETRTYIAPLLTSLKFYPFTGPGGGFEPFVLGGLGFAFLGRKGGRRGGRSGRRGGRR